MEFCASQEGGGPPSRPLAQRSALSLGRRFPAQSCPSFHCLLSFPFFLCPPKALTFASQRSTAQSGTQKLPSKRPHSSASSEKKEEEVSAKNCILSPSLLQEPPQKVRAGEGTGWV